MSDYLTQHPDALPSGVEAYRRTSEFTEQTLPVGLRKDHATKPGVWALIHVLPEEGSVNPHIQGVLPERQ
jgi:tellurite resistance-related uncharacterized protein